MIASRARSTLLHPATSLAVVCERDPSMEALAAVGLAGNIVQFIDFSCKLFEQTTAITRAKAQLQELKAWNPSRKICNLLRRI
jgi:hypothetical protein